jgi:hypothetical protein
MSRIHGTTKLQVRCSKKEKPFFQQLPLTRFECYRICERTVHFDGHAEVDGAYYSPPPRCAGRNVPVHVGRLWLRILDRETQECGRVARPGGFGPQGSRVRRRVALCAGL